MARRISREVAFEVLRLYNETDSLGRGIWTQQQLADRFGIGEASVNRIIKRAASFRGMAQPLSESEMNKRAHESAARVALELGIPLPPRVEQPPAHQEQLTAAEHLSQAIAAEKQRQAERNPDNLLKELINGTDERPPTSPLDE